jgi:hypothetical protein
MNLRRSRDGHGWEPGFPKRIKFLLLADLRNAKWGIYEYGSDRNNESWTPSNPVSDELEALICSGKRYPPALAIARAEMNRIFHTYQPDQQEFSEAYAKAIQSRLALQHEAPYFMAKAVSGDGIDLVPGELFWLLRIKGDPPMASWVSDDFFIYENPISDFELTGNQIGRINTLQRKAQKVRHCRAQTLTIKG